MKLLVLVAVFIAVVALAGADKDHDTKPGDIVLSNQAVREPQPKMNGKPGSKPTGKVTRKPTKKPKSRRPRPTKMKGRTKGSKKPRPTKLKGPGRTKGSKKPHRPTKPNKTMRP